MAFRSVRLVTKMWDRKLKHKNVTFIRFAVQQNNKADINPPDSRKRH